MSFIFFCLCVHLCVLCVRRLQFHDQNLKAWQSWTQTLPPGRRRQGKSLWKACRTDWTRSQLPHPASLRAINQFHSGLKCRKNLDHLKADGLSMKEAARKVEKRLLAKAEMLKTFVLAIQYRSVARTIRNSFWHQNYELHSYFCIAEKKMDTGTSHSIRKSNFK